VRALALRVARLEGAVAGTAPSPSYVVSLPPEALGDDEAVRAAISEHRRRTGWTKAVVVMPHALTTAEWSARYGRADD
jgi:hypothetical protein